METKRCVSRSLISLYILTISLGLLGCARVDSLFENLNNAPSTAVGVFPIGANTPEGDSFSTGSLPFQMTGVQLKLQGVQDSASFTISLYSDNKTSCAAGPSCTGGPQTLLTTIATVNDNSLSASMANYSFALASPFALAPKTRYWIVASSTTNSGTNWSYTEDLSGRGVAGQFNITTTLILPDADTDPGCMVSVSPGVNANACAPYQMEVSGTSILEPDVPN